MSPRHREALAHLLYGIDEGGGFVALTGEVGTGKTTICRCLLEQIPDNIDVALIINPRLNAIELLANVCDELRIKIAPETTSLKVLVDALNEYLLQSFAQGRYTVIIIDEAQNLSFDVLEQIRLLTNLETSEAKLLKIILVGQPELNALLERNDLRQLNQRITARYHLTPMSEDETASYIYHRLSISGGYKRLFPKDTIRKIYRCSNGVPRLINIICDRALLGAYANESYQVSKKIVRNAVREVLPGYSKKSKLSRITRVVSIIALVGLGLLALGYTALPALNRSGWVNKHFESMNNWFDSSNSNEAAVASRAESTGSKIPDRTPSTDSGSPETIRLDEILTSLPPQPGDTDDLLLQTTEKSNIPKPSSTARVTVNDIGVTKKNALGKTDTPLRSGTKTVVYADELEHRISDPKLSMPTALVQLSQQWGLKYSPDFGGLCKTAKLHGLNCFTQTANWTQLARINRPAILQITLKPGGNRYITLIGLDKHFAYIKFFDNTPRKVGLKNLSEYWNGQYSIFWKSIDPKRQLLAPGMLALSVQTLRELLSTIHNNSKPPQSSNYFDAALKTQLMAFQKQQGLTEDGLAGIMTMIALNNAANVPGIPKITKRIN